MRRSRWDPASIELRIDSAILQFQREPQLLVFSAPRPMHTNLLKQTIQQKGERLQHTMGYSNSMRSSNIAALPRYQLRRSAPRASCCSANLPGQGARSAQPPQSCQSAQIPHAPAVECCKQTG